MRLELSFCIVLLATLSLLSVGCNDGYMPDDEFRTRQDAYLAFATAEPIRPESILNVLNHLERARRDPGYDVPAGSVPAEAWDPVFAKLYELRDTSDFDLLYLLNTLYAFGGHPAADPALWAAAEQAVLDFKYWYTDPTPERLVDGEQVIDNMWYWSENHVLLFRVNEFLAGQLFPDRTFTVTGLSGAEHMARAREGIDRWITERGRFGFTEWHSDVYYQKDLTPLLSLIEWGRDQNLAQRASMALDLVFLDVALHLHRGNFGATHGRSYIKDKATALAQDNFNSSKLFFEDTSLEWTSTGAADASLFARAQHYRLPEVIRRIAKYDAPMVDRERMNLPLSEKPNPNPKVPPPAAPPGFDFADEDDLPFFWSMGAQTLWSLVPLTLEVAERENLWIAQFSEFKLLRDVIWVEGDFEQTLRNARPWLVLLWPIIDQALLQEVNTYTYRTEDYMLSTAQDYRKGLRGSQTHISQATLSEHAVVFTTHPTYRPVEAGAPIPPDWNWQQEDEPGPGYWTGNGAEPRAAQYENVSISIYAPQYGPIPSLGFDYSTATHAYFPVAHFDEVIKDPQWIFGRKDGGYVALWSNLRTGWRPGQPEVNDNQGAPFDLVAPFLATNVWILECGSASDWESFDAFVAAFRAASVTTTPIADQGGDGFTDGYDVAYHSPSQGLITFGWHAPLVVNGLEVPLGDYPRFDNPFVQAEFDDGRYDVMDGDYRLTLDFSLDKRKVAGPAEGPVPAR